MVNKDGGGDKVASFVHGVWSGGGAGVGATNETEVDDQRSLMGLVGMTSYNPSSA